MFEHHVRIWWSESTDILICIIVSGLGCTLIQQLIGGASAGHLPQNMTPRPSEGEPLIKIDAPL